MARMIVELPGDIVEIVAKSAETEAISKLEVVRRWFGVLRTVQQKRDRGNELGIVNGEKVVARLWTWFDLGVYDRLNYAGRPKKSLSRMPSTRRAPSSVCTTSDGLFPFSSPRGVFIHWRASSREPMTYSAEARMRESRAVCAVRSVLDLVIIE